MMYIQKLREVVKDKPEQFSEMKLVIGEVDELLDTLRDIRGTLTKNVVTSSDISRIRGLTRTVLAKHE